VKSDQGAGVPNLGQTLGRWLAYYRGDMSVRELAEKASVSKSVISRLEKGKSEDPSLGKVLRLQRALGLPSIEMLLGGPHAFPSDPDDSDPG
jgi:transcriptional regulator with XRE-family HTH domain